MLNGTYDRVKTVEYECRRAKRKSQGSFKWRNRNFMCSSRKGCSEKVGKINMSKPVLATDQRVVTREPRHNDFCFRKQKVVRLVNHEFP
jgi:hypothetical protein